MNADGLLRHYERIADSPTAIARLRRYVRELAVRGKLVTQDNSDGSAVGLVRQSTTPTPRDPHLTVPTTWAWTNVGTVADSRLGKMLDKAKNKGKPRRYLRNINVRWFDFDLSDLQEMPFEDTELSEYALRSGDVLICEGGEPGRAAVWDEREPGIYFQKAIHRVRFVEGVEGAYFAVALRESADSGRLANYFTGTGIKHFTGKGLDSYLFSIPPLTEQHRIVAKVDELMALCDRLEAARAEREAVRDRLAAASLARLNAPDPETFQADARFTFDTLPALTTRPDQIKQLRQTILNLAVRGKLVPQDSNDEPAALLLNRIASEKAQLVRRGELKKTEGVQNLTNSVQDLSVPSGWTVTNLQSICTSVADGDHLPPPKAEKGIPFLVIGNVRSQRIEFEGSRFVAQSYFDSLDPIRRPRRGDLLYTLVGSYGIPVIVRGDDLFCVQRHIGILRPSSLVDVNFLARAMGSRYVFDQATQCATGIAQKTIPLSGLRRMLLPLPPLAEQCRIVAKVESLMALCDQLEASLTDMGDTRRHLLDALLTAALRPSEDRREAA